MLKHFHIQSLFLAPLFLLTAAFGQQPQPGGAPESLSSAANAQTGSREIHLNVVVSPKGGDPVAGLQQQDFTLFDNKIAKPFNSFRALSQGQEPTRVIILIDAVNINFQNVAYERQELDKFLRSDGGHLTLPTSLAIFKDTETDVQKGFSLDGNALAGDLDQAVIGLRDLRRNTGIYGADERFQLSLKTLEQLTSSLGAIPGRKLLLWASPGWPLLTGPRIQLDRKQEDGLYATIAELSTRLREANITLYSIDSLGVSEGLGRVNYYQEFTKGVSKPGQVQLGNLALQVLAVQSGGLALNSSDIGALFRKCIADTRSYYQLSFSSQPADSRNEYHHIEVKLSRPDLVARTRDGYYAQP